jgi:CubicO group peptidase (beta-lactamase class C family)
VPVSRRMCIEGGASVAASLLLGTQFGRANGDAARGVAPTPAEKAAMQEVASAFMRAYTVPALQIAIAHEGEFVYSEAFGLADRERREEATPAHRFRIASISKPITSAAVFTLIERGDLRLDTRVFGKGGVLAYLDISGSPARDWIEEITVEQLLTHTSGGWSNEKDDPMFERPELSQIELIRWTLQSHALLQPPGTAYAYSNFGYCVLGRIIEAVTRQPYASYVQEAVLRPAGVLEMSLAENTLGERQVREVRYYAPPGVDPYRANVRRMDSHGGWIASACDLVMFANHATGLAPAAVLQPASITEMTTASRANPRYAKGWEVNSAGNWWHNGSLNGTTTILVRTATRFCWAALANTRPADGTINRDIDNLVWNMARMVRGWAA